MTYEDIMVQANAIYHRYRVKHLKKGNLEWELGYVTADALIRNDLVLMRDYALYTLYGIPVRINKQVPELIKLWEEVE